MVYSLGALVVVGALAAIWIGQKRAPGEAAGPTAVVVRGPMTISIVEGGEIEAKTSTKISNDLPWTVVIKKVVPEGTLVKRGDLIIEFECQELKNALNTQQLLVAQATSDYTGASESLALLKRQMDLTVRTDEQAVVDAEEALKCYVSAEAPLALQNALSDIDVADRDLALAKDKLTFKQDANKDPSLNQPYSLNEIRAEELTVNRLKLGLEKARSLKEMLVKFDTPKKVRQLTIAVETAKLTMEKDRVEARTSVATAEALERAKKQTLDKGNEIMAERMSDIKKLAIYAEQDGLVVYALGNSRRRATDIVIEAKEKIEPNTQLMIVPDMSTLQVRTKVYESMIEQVKKGQPAFIRLDAKPTMAIKGAVSDVSVLPDSSNWWNPEIKYFNVIVKLDKEAVGLKPGMTTQVELVLATLPDNTLSVPIAALFSERDQSFCWRVRGSAVEKVNVKVGRLSDTRVQILEGLNEGDVLRLSQPPASRNPGPGESKDKPTPADQPEKKAKTGAAS